jgi:paired amphipathic helix protein Sin3a
MEPSAGRDSEKSTIDPRDLPPKDSYVIHQIHSQPDNLNYISNNNNNNANKPRAQLETTRGGATPLSAPSLIPPSSINNMASSTASTGANFQGIPSVLPLSLSHHGEQNQISGMLRSAGFINSNVAPVGGGGAAAGGAAVAPPAISAPSSVTQRPVTNPTITRGSTNSTGTSTTAVVGAHHVAQPAAGFVSTSVPIAAPSTAVDQNPVGLSQATPSPSLLKNAAAATGTSTSTIAGSHTRTGTLASVAGQNAIASTSSTAVSIGKNNNRGNGSKAPDCIPTNNSPAKKALTKKGPNAGVAALQGHTDSPTTASDLPPKTSAGVTSKKAVVLPSAAAAGFSSHVGVAVTASTPALNGIATKKIAASSTELRGNPVAGDESKVGGSSFQSMQQRLQPSAMSQQQQKQQLMYKQQPLNNPRLGGAPTATAATPSTVHSGLEGPNGPPHRTPAGAMQHSKHHNPPMQVMQAHPTPQRLQAAGLKAATMVERAALPQRMNPRALQPPTSSQRGQQEERTMPPPVRELKVEDALLYLDQVKEAFGDRPRIYNEFLEIMKNFKAQQIDTPGVIKRVSNLFYGYNNLILGFNTFLPEGYKIELRDLEQQQEPDHIRVHQPQQQQQQLQQQLQQQQPPKSVGRGKTQQQIGPAPQVGHVVGAPPGRFPPTQQQHPHLFQPSAQVQQSSQQQQQPKPQTATQIRQAGPMALQQQHLHHAPPQMSSQQPAVGLPGRVGPPMGFQPIQHSGPQGPPQIRTSHGPLAGQVAPSQQQQQQQPQQQPPTQAVEFDHAISYVTTIKKRFEKQPQIYQQFLEILHTYQKEQRGIKEVLEQVSSLFANHPDLLKEFTYFLPDAVQEQAKERLHRAVMESEARLQMRAAAARHHQEASASLPHPVQSARVAAVEPPTPLQAQHQKQQQQLFEQSSAPKQLEPQLSDVLLESKEAPKSTQKQPIVEKEITKGDSITPKSVPVTSPAPLASIPRPHPPQPETFVYNTAVERQFFDTLKEVLTSNSRDGGVAWAEFLKCLDLYGQEVLSRVELLGYVEELLGKRHADLFEEFKRVLAAAGSPTAMNDDTWFSVPLSEIDFTRCRKCTPSYRALPRDYPSPPCSDRLDLETSVLNDVWVSLPVGSEESYTFRHMRRNQHEETLFRVEDERFEIDMVIDSNANTLRRLEPIAEEISLLSRKELSLTSLTENDGKIQNSLCHSALSKKCIGAGGKQFQYVLDKKILTTIHLFSIMRIYGDFGQTMIKLLFSNPTKAVPIVVKRLRQKDREWREARNALNRRWKELVDQNYFKCLDHRSLTWRTLDKRATSTRTLLAEIRDRAANNGMESESALATKREKAKEEYGPFYEVSMGRSLRRNLDLSNFPKPVSSIFTPHLSVIYENVSWAQLDAYRVLVFALEKGSSISPADKDRGHRILRDCIGPLFGLSYSLLFGHGVNNLPTINGHFDPAQSESENLQEDVTMEEDASENTGSVAENEAFPSGMPQSSTSDFTVIDQQPVGNGTTVATVFGEGALVSYRNEDNMFVVRLAFGLSYLNPNAIICTLQPAPQSSLTDGLRAEDVEELPRGDLLLMGNQSLYLFFRLHDVLVKRLNVAKRIAFEVSERGEKFSSVETITGGPSEDALQVGRKRYEAYLSLLYSLLEGGATAAEGDKYEDRLRLLMGHYAFELSTMDKLVSHLLKHLQNMGNDEILNSLMQLHKRHLDAGSFKPNAFRQEAAILSEGEMIYAFQYSRVPNSDKSIMHYEYLGCLSDTDEDEEDSATGEEDRDQGSVDEVVNDTDGEGNSSSQPSSKRQRR